MHANSAKSIVVWGLGNYLILLYTQDRKKLSNQKPLYYSHKHISLQLGANHHGNTIAKTALQLTYHSNPPPISLN